LAAAKIYSVKVNALIYLIRKMVKNNMVLTNTKFTNFVFIILPTRFHSPLQWKSR